MKWVLLTFAALILCGTGFAGYLGYFGGSAIIDLPATAAAAPAHPRLAAVVLSGDMGFNVGMAPKIARSLNERGIPVVAVNSLIWFRQRRTPADMVALVNAVTHRALAWKHADRVVLIGQSFGAETLGAGLTGLVPDLRARILMVGLIVPTDTVFYRASPAELFNWAEPDALALPAARKLDWVPTICIHGVQEEHSLCPLLTKRNVIPIAMRGGHMLQHNADAVNAVLGKAIALLAARRARTVTKTSASNHRAAVNRSNKDNLS